MTRRRLRDVELTGGRRTTRALLVGAMITCAALAALGALVERHRADGGWDDRTDWGPWHSYLTESYGLTLFVPLLIVAAAVWARRGFPRGMAAGLVGGAGVFGMLVILIAAHLFDNTDENGASAFLIVGWLGLALTSPLTLLADPLLVILERRRLEREVDPVFPTARVIDR